MPATCQNILAARIGPVFEIEADQVLGQPPIADLVDLVQDKVEQIESRDQGRRKVDVGRNGQARVIFRVDRVRRGQDRGTSVEGRDDTGLGDRDGLLFLKGEATVSS